MSACVALLRGVNVSGKNPIPMASLRDSVAALGFTGVQTYLQSGNLVFRAAKAGAGALAANAASYARQISGRIARDFGHSVRVLVVTSQKLDALARANMLWPASGGDAAQFHCTFLFEPATTARFAALKLPAVQGERALLVAGAVLLHCPHGYGRTKLNNAYFERALGVAATTRNWRTVLALQALCKST